MLASKIFWFFLRIEASFFSKLLEATENGEWEVVFTRILLTANMLGGRLPRISSASSILRFFFIDRAKSWGRFLFRALNARCRI